MNGHDVEERRHHPGIREPFPVLVRGVDMDGQAFELHVVLDNISAGGFYMTLKRHVKPGTKLFSVVRLSSAPDSAAPAPRVAVRGVVRRVEPQPGGRWGLGVQFRHHRFL
jgi:hypothetical protein